MSRFVISLLLLLIPLSACTGDPEAAAPTGTMQRLDPTVSETTEPEPEEPEESEATPVELTEEEQWALAYDESQAAYATAVASALDRETVRGVTAERPLASCTLLAEDLDIGARTSKAAEALALRRPPTAEQMFAVVTAATTYVCPELAQRHATQVTTYL